MWGCFNEFSYFLSRFAYYYQHFVSFYHIIMLCVCGNTFIYILSWIFESKFQILWPFTHQYCDVYVLRPNIFLSEIFKFIKSNIDIILLSKLSVAIHLVSVFFITILFLVQDHVMYLVVIFIPFPLIRDTFLAFLWCCWHLSHIGQFFYKICFSLSFLIIPHE